MDGGRGMSGPGDIGRRAGPADRRPQGTFSVGGGIPGNCWTRVFPRRLTVSTESKAAQRKPGRQMVSLRCGLSAGVCGSLSLDSLIWMAGARGQCPFPRPSFTGLTVLPISAGPGSRRQQAWCHDRHFLNSLGLSLTPVWPTSTPPPCSGGLRA